MLTVTKIFEFAAAHHLPHHKGKCKNLHGHSYKLEITVSGAIQKEGAESGMIIDFGRLKEVVKDICLNNFDHRNLNDYYENPTAEIMVEGIAGGLTTLFNNKIRVVRVRLWETSTSYAEWKADELL